MTNQLPHTTDDMTLAITGGRMFSRWNLLIMFAIIIGGSILLSFSFSNFEHKNTGHGLFFFTAATIFSVAMSFCLKSRTLLKSFFGINILAYTVALVSLIRVGAVGPGFILFIIFIFVIYYIILLENSYYE